jgi:hypothetical protein
VLLALGLELYFISLSSFLALILLLIIYIFSITPTVLIVVGLMPVFLIYKGEIMTEQGKKYALLVEYPSYWFKNTIQEIKQGQKTVCCFCTSTF